MNGIVLSVRRRRGWCALRESQEKQSHFDGAMLPHLDAAYNLARWLVRREEDARDVVQDAYLRAWRFFDSFHGEAEPSRARAWLLTIVRNTAHTFLGRDRKRESKMAEFDESIHEVDSTAAPDARAVREADEQMLRAALDELPAILREAIVLREMEGLSYKQIADAVGAPMGTVMSRISRARAQLCNALTLAQQDVAAGKAGQP